MEAEKMESYWLWLCSLEDITAQKKVKLLNLYSTLLEIKQAKRYVLEKLHILNE